MYYRDADRSAPRAEWDSARAFLEWLRTNVAGGSRISVEGRERIAEAQRRRWERRGVA
jgi:hypothetical protein